MECGQAAPAVGIALGQAWADLDEVGSAGRHSPLQDSSQDLGFGNSTETVLDLRDSATNGQYQVFAHSNNAEPATPSMPAAYMGTQEGLQRASDELIVDLEQLLQALLLAQGLLEDQEVGPEGLGAGIRAQTPNEAQAAPTLREMRRAGPLATLSEDAQTTLLGGTLFEYCHTGTTPQAMASPLRGQSRQCLRRPGTSCGYKAGGGVNDSCDQGATRGNAMDCSADLLPVSPSASFALPPLAELLRLSLDRLLQPSARDSSGTAAPNGPSLGDSFADSADVSVLDSARSGAFSAPTMPATPGSMRSAEVSCIQLRPASAASATSGSMSVSSRGLLPPMLAPDTSTAQAESVVSPASASSITASGGDLSRPVIGIVRGSPGQLVDMEYDEEADETMPANFDDDGVVSVAGFDSPTSGTPSRSTSSWRPRRLQLGSRLRTAEPDALDETTSIWGFGDTARGSPSSGRSASVPDSARTVLGETLSLEGGLDGGLSTVLHRLALENLSLDDSLTRSVRRVLQLGTVLTGQRLSDEEICALPKVRFEAKEQQNCAICLEAYKEGELLTALRCAHFYHVDCLARWFQRSTQCPLCRDDCGT